MNYFKVMKSVSCLVVSDSMRPRGLYSLPGSSVHGIFQARILEGVSSHSLLQGILPTQGLNTSLLHCKQILYHMSLQGLFQVSKCCEEFRDYVEERSGEDPLVKGIPEDKNPFKELKGGCVIS
uniref:Guanine nucleotide-binding protein subunit gamma n=1 Tax=Bos mutus grunniens TaxID=30521 RepID=A0A8B9XQD1_BOSMU